MLDTVGSVAHGHLLLPVFLGTALYLETLVSEPHPNSWISSENTSWLMLILQLTMTKDWPELVDIKRMLCDHSNLQCIALPPCLWTNMHTPFVYSLMLCEDLDCVLMWLCWMIKNTTSPRYQEDLFLLLWSIEAFSFSSGQNNQETFYNVQTIQYPPIIVSCHWGEVKLLTATTATSKKN